MARVEISTGLGTWSSPGKDISTSSADAPHLLYHGRDKGLDMMVAAIATAPNPSSIIVELYFISANFYIPIIFLFIAQILIVIIHGSNKNKQSYGEM